MFKVQMKQLINKKWDIVDINRFEGRSIISYMDEEQEPTIAAMFQDDKPVLFIVKQESDVEAYSKKGLCITVEEMKLLIADVKGSIPQIILKSFPNGKVEAIKYGKIKH